MKEGRFEALGKYVFDLFDGLIAFFRFVVIYFRCLSTFHAQKQIGFDVIVKQIYFTGVEALALICLIALSIGSLIILQGNLLLATFGQTRWVYILLVSIVIRELSVIITGLIVVARSGTSISTELGNMVVNQEIELLHSYGISPITYLVVSRTAGVVAALFTLSIFFNLVAVFGGWFVSNLFYPIYFGDFIAFFVNEVSIYDILVSVLKSLLFGFSIALVSSYHGLKVVKATTEVPQRTIKAVVNCILAMVIIDIIINYFYFMLTS